MPTSSSNSSSRKVWLQVRSFVLHSKSTHRHSSLCLRQSNKSESIIAELPAGQEVNFLVGFKNNGKQDFVVETLDSSLRYPTDFNYVIQNYSTAVYNRLVKPSHEATFAYAFTVNDALAERPFSFLVNLKYKDATGKRFSSAAFNQTVNIYEFDNGFNLQTLFIYLFLASLAFGILYTIYSFISSKLHIGKYNKKSKVETGTTSATEKVDYDWIPEQINSSTFSLAFI
jgi:translocon-associated protein subunit alpha